MEVLVACGLLCISWYTYIHWRYKSEEKIPVFSMIALTYWIYYAVPIFWGDRLVSDIHSSFRELPENAITEAELMAFLGVCSMWLGVTLASRIKRVPGRRLEVPLTQSRLNYLRALLVVGSLLNLAEPSGVILGEGFRQIVTLTLSAIPTVVFVILFRQFVRKESTLLDKALIAGYLIVRLIAGLSSGTLGSFSYIIIICAAILISERRRIPRMALVSVVLFVVFFQPGKADFRDVYWKEDVRASMTDRVGFWVDRSVTKWGEALSDQTGDARRDLLNQSLSRVSLLSASANVIDQTPSVVPYQNGQLYSYMAITFIPRFLWPDKPSVSEANHFYQLAYGVSTEEQLSQVSISIGILVEGFINFGWPGAIGIMFLIGIIVRLYQTTCFGQGSSLLMNSIGIVLLPGFLAIEGQLSVYIGGIIQQILFMLLVLLPVIRVGRASQESVPRFGGSQKRSSLLQPAE